MQVAVGPQHVVMLTLSGEAYAWGCGTGGRLGLGHANDAVVPERIVTLWNQPVKQLAAGGETSYVSSAWHCKGRPAA